MQLQILSKRYPNLSFTEMVGDEAEDLIDQAVFLFPGNTTDDPIQAPSTVGIPAAPVHNAVLKKFRDITARMKSKEPKGTQAMAKPPSRLRLANLTRPNVTVRKVVTMKKEVASRIQSSLALSSAETVLLKENIRNKNAPALSSSSDSYKLAKAKFDTIGTIMGAANWVEILREHVAKSLREPVPDMASIFHTLELLGKINIHGVVDGACKLHAAAI
jgi:hypothetical protein